jgi:hypothetical protein
MPDSVNPQITDAITQTVTATVGQSASVALGMFFQVEAQAFSLSMQNAVNSQHNINQIGEATTAVAVAKIMALLK